MPMTMTATMIRPRGFAAAVLELVPDELAQTGTLGQHFGGDQYHPGNPSDMRMPVKIMGMDEGSTTFQTWVKKGRRRTWLTLRRS